tara:strand:- start:41417 stop:41803 length:387 start_codon:yes stop_codon:yes gene_type:complete
MDDINTFEQENGFKFPIDYKLFLLSNNGGVPKENLYYDEENRLEIDIALFRPLKYGNYPLEEVIKDLHEDDYISTSFLPFARDSGSGQYLLSMRNEDFGSVFINYSDSIEPLKLCNSFEQFIDRLETE